MTARLLFLLLGAALGTGAASAWWWLDIQHVYSVSPGNTHPLLYAFVQLPPWYSAVTAGVLAAWTVAVWVGGTLVGKRRESRHGPARRRSATWMNWVRAQARIRELEAEAVRYTDDMTRLMEMAHEYKRQLTAIDAVRKGTVVDEVAERRMLEGRR